MQPPQQVVVEVLDASRLTADVRPAESTDDRWLDDVILIREHVGGTVPVERCRVERCRRGAGAVVAYCRGWAIDAGPCEGGSRFQRGPP